MSHHLPVCLPVPAVSGSSVATPNGSGSILLNFDHKEQSQNSSGAQLPVAPPPQQQGECSVCLPACLFFSIKLPAFLTAACCRTPIRLQPDGHQQFTLPQVCRSSTPRYTHNLCACRFGSITVTMTTTTSCSSGLLLHTSRVTAKRERESERDSSSEKEANCPLNKMQRQSTKASPLLFLLPASHSTTRPQLSSSSSPVCSPIPALFRLPELATGAPC